MGLSKTHTTLLFMAYYATVAAEQRLQNQVNFCPILCIVPSGMVLHQWSEAIQLFLGLTLIIVHGNKLRGEGANWVSAKAIRNAPTNLEHWPKHLQYTFNKASSYAAKMIVLTSYKTFASWTLSIQYRKTALQTEKVYMSKWTGVVNIVIIDKGHRIWRLSTKFFASIKQLEANTHWFITAMPSINNLFVIFPYQYKRNSADPEH